GARGVRRRGARRDPRPGDHAPAGGGSGGVAPVLPSAPGARREPRPEGALHGHEPGLQDRRGGGRDLRSRWLRVVARLTFPAAWVWATSGIARSSTSASPRSTTTPGTTTGT